MTLPSLLYHCIIYVFNTMRNARSAPNRYNSNKHETYIPCPRNCGARNAPPDSDDFKPKCWSCNTGLGIQPVDVGDEVEVEVFDIHANGAGLGRTEDGFIVFIDGVLPEKIVTAKIKRVKETTADAELIEVIDDDPNLGEEEEEPEEDEEEAEDPMREEQKDDRPEPLGSRDDFWG